MSERWRSTRERNDMNDTKRLDESMGSLRSQISALDIDDDQTKQRLKGLIGVAPLSRTVDDLIPK